MKMPGHSTFRMFIDYCKFSYKYLVKVKIMGSPKKAEIQETLTHHFKQKRECRKFLI